VAATWPLAGLAEELSLISELTRRRDGPTGVVLAGPAGVGKTRLAREVLAAAQQRGAVTRWAVATASARALPLGAFAATVGVVGPDPARLVRQASDALLAGGGRAGVIVGVDDAHLLDELSAVLVHQLVLRQAATVVRQLVEGELESHKLHQVAGLWWWSGRPELSPGLVELVSARIGQLPGAQRAVMEVLAFGEPLGVTLLAKLTDAVAVEQAESRGLVEVHPDGRRLQARLAHPLYGEVQRAQLGTLYARRLRGRIAAALAATGARRADDTLRRALLVQESDLPPDPVLLTAAARRATELGALALAVQIATAAVAAGGGFEPRLLMGNALTWSGGAAEAETELAELATLARGDAEQVQAAIPRVFALAWGLARPAQAEAVLDDVGSTISDEVATTELTGIRSILDASLGRSVQAAHTAAGVLADPRCSQAAEELATWGLAASCGALGRLDGLAERVRRIDARAEAFETGLLQAAAIGSSWVRGLLLAGLIDQAEQAVQRYRERCQDTPGPGELITSTMCGAVAQARGLVKTAARWFRQVLAGNGNWSFSLLTDLPGVLGMAGKASLARQALEEMTAARTPSLILSCYSPGDGRRPLRARSARPLRSPGRLLSWPRRNTNRLRRCWCCTPRSASVTARWPTGSPNWPARSTAPAPRPQQRTPPLWPPTTVRHRTLRRFNSRRWAPCYWPPTPPLTPPPRTLAMSSEAPPKPLPPVPTSSPRPVRAPAHRRWLRWPRRCR